MKTNKKEKKDKEGKGGNGHSSLENHLLGKGGGGGKEGVSSGLPREKKKKRQG